MDIRLKGPAFAWGRNRGMHNPAVISVVHFAHGEPSIDISVYSAKGFDRGTSPVHVQLTPHDARQLIAGLRLAMKGAR